MAVKPKDLEKVKTDLAKIAAKVENLSTKQSKSGQSTDSITDFSVPAANLWLKEKLAHISTYDNSAFRTAVKDLVSEKMELPTSFNSSAFRSAVRGLVVDKLDTFTISVANFSETTKKIVGKWGQSAVVEDLYNIVKSNADVVVLGLAAELEKKVLKTEVSPEFKTGIEEALKLLQKSIKSNKDDIEKISSKSAQHEIENLMAVATVKAIFSNFNDAATKVLETLKLWSHLQPVREQELSEAAQNLLDFQQSKGK